MEVDCPNCRTVNDSGLQFCSECGTPLSAVCQPCGFANRPGAKFCGRCGQPLTKPDSDPDRRPIAIGDRRQVAVLFADLCGFTRLSSELDAEDVHQILGRFFETVDGVVERSGGRIDKHIGDAVMAIFGAPVAHDNDAERAVHAAVEIHRAIARLGETLGRELQVHIGIAGGEVVASGTGSSRHQEYTVTGEAVNLAARLNDAAKPGETLASEAIYRSFGGKIDGESLGDVAIPGLSDPIGVWRIRGYGAAPRSLAPLVGRRNELRQFVGALESCRDTRAGQTIYLRGEAGIGKTRLAEEFISLAEAAGFACHKALVLDFGAAEDEDVIRALVRSLLGIAADADRAERERAAESVLREGSIDESARVFLNDLLSLPQPTELRAVFDAMKPSTRDREQQAVVARLVSVAAARRPLLLVVEDIHWAAPLTLQHLARVSASTTDCPTILLLTSRIQGDPLDQAWRAMTHDSPLLTLDLAPLRREEAMAFAAGFRDVVDQLAQQCVERAAGNPLFLEQLLRGAEDYAAGGVPASIQSLVVARMDLLSPLDRRALQVAATVGQRFSLDALRSILDEREYELDGLIRAFLVRPAGGEYLFAHALIRDAAYGSLLKKTRRELHRRAAAWFAGRDPTLTAEHLDRAEDTGAPAAYLAAAVAQAAGYRFERALELTRRGLELSQKPADTFALALLKAELLLDMGAVADASAAYGEAVQRALDHVALCRARLGLAAAMRVSDQYSSALTELEAAEPLAEKQGLSRELSSIHHLRGNVYFSLGNIAGCLAEHERALDHARQASWKEGEARALGGLGDANYLRGRMASAHDLFTRCVALCQANGFGRIEVANRHMIGWSGLYLGPLAEAEREGLAATEMASRVSHHRAEMLGRFLVVFVRIETGELTTVRRELDLAHGLARRLGARNFEVQAFIHSGRLLALEGHRPEAMAEAQKALEISRLAGIAFLGPMILGTIARLAEDPHTCRDALAEAEALLAAGAVGHNYFWFYRDAIDVALAYEDWPLAERYAAALQAYTAAEPIVWADLIVARGRALAALGRGRRGPELAKEVVRLKRDADRLGWHQPVPALNRAIHALGIASG
jgi:class 3 adenylate cyclase/tetratricopeptide (TPR) repeat protein